MSTRPSPSMSTVSPASARSTLSLLMIGSTSMPASVDGGMQTDSASFSSTSRWSMAAWISWIIVSDLIAAAMSTSLGTPFLAPIVGMKAPRPSLRGRYRRFDLPGRPPQIGSKLSFITCQKAPFIDMVRCGTARESTSV